MLITAITWVHILSLGWIHGLNLKPPGDITMETYTYNFDQPLSPPVNWNSFQSRLGVADEQGPGDGGHQVNRRHFSPIFTPPDPPKTNFLPGSVQKNVFMYSPSTLPNYHVPNYYAQNNPKYNILFIKSPPNTVPKIFIPEAVQNPLLHKNIVVLFQKNPSLPDQALMNTITSSLVAPPYVHPIVPNYDTYASQPITAGIPSSNYPGGVATSEVQPLFMSNAFSQKHLKLDPTLDNDIEYQDNWRWTPSKRPNDGTKFWSDIPKKAPQEQKIKMNIFTYGLPEQAVKHIFEERLNTHKNNNWKVIDPRNPSTASNVGEYFPRSPIYSSSASQINSIPETTTFQPKTSFSLCNVLNLCDTFSTSKQHFPITTPLPREVQTGSSGQKHQFSLSNTITSNSFTTQESFYKEADKFKTSSESTILDNTPLSDNIFFKSTSTSFPTQTLANDQAFQEIKVTQDREVTTTTEHNQAAATTTEHNQAATIATEHNQAATTTTEHNQASTTTMQHNQAVTTTTEHSQASTTTMQHNQAVTTTTEHSQAATTTTEHNQAVPTALGDSQNSVTITRGRGKHPKESTDVFSEETSGHNSFSTSKSVNSDPNDQTETATPASRTTLKVFITEKDLEGLQTQTAEVTTVRTSPSLPVISGFTYSDGSSETREHPGVSSVALS